MERRLNLLLPERITEDWLLELIDTSMPMDPGRPESLWYGLRGRDLKGVGLWPAAAAHKIVAAKSFENLWDGKGDKYFLDVVLEWGRASTLAHLSEFHWVDLECSKRGLDAYFSRKGYSPGEPVKRSVEKMSISISKWGDRLDVSNRPVSSGSYRFFEVEEYQPK